MTSPVAGFKLDGAEGADGTDVGAFVGGAGGGPALFQEGGGPLNLSSGPDIPGRSRLPPGSGPRVFRGSGGPGRGPERGSGGPERVSEGPERVSGGPRRSSERPRSNPRGSR